MLDRNVDVDMERSDGTLLRYAASLGRARIVRVLLDAGADVNRTSPLTAALDRPEIVALLLDRGADPNGTVDGETILVHAAGAGYAPTLSLLIKHGVRVREPDGASALRKAWQEDRADAVRVLQMAGVAEPEAATLFDALPFPSPLGKFLANGADPNQRDAAGRTPLIAAAAAKNLGAVRILLEHGADPDAKDEEGKSALAHLGDWMCGCGEGYLGEARVAALLLAKGAHVPPLSRQDVLLRSIQECDEKTFLESIQVGDFWPPSTRAVERLLCLGNPAGRVEGWAGEGKWGRDCKVKGKKEGIDAMGDTGQSNDVSVYRGDKKNGPSCFWQKGSLFSKCTYKDDLEDGPCFNSFYNGRRMFEGTFRKGQATALRWYWPDGRDRPSKDARYLLDLGNGIMVERRYSDDGGLGTELFMREGRVFRHRHHQGWSGLYREQEGRYLGDFSDGPCRVFKKSGEYVETEIRQNGQVVKKFVEPGVKRSQY